MKVAPTATGKVRGKIGGKTRFLLSGLLHCAVCGANYVIADAYSYACSSFANGGPAACSNDVRVNRKKLEATILGPVIADLKDPARVKSMAQRMERQFAKKMQAHAEKVTTLPAELQKLDERLAKLRTIAELDDDERLPLIDKTEHKRRELMTAQSAAMQQAKYWRFCRRLQ